MKEILKRRVYTEERVNLLRSKLAGTEQLLLGRACVYATGSYGRREASGHSDLDLFIVGKTASSKDGRKESMLSKLSEICVKADLIRTTRAVGIPDFDGDGKYLTHQPVHLLNETLGKPEDDAINTFTARLLLLLESSPLLGKDVYDEIIRDVIAAYWGDYEDHPDDFIPAFLANDILRLWRTFCVNYEARTERKPDEKKLKRKIKNYKLKFSRLMTCYSGLLYLLWAYGRKGTVGTDDMLDMISRSPTARVEYMENYNESSREIKECLRNRLEKHNSFLQVTDAPEAKLLEQFGDRKYYVRYITEAREFGDLMFDAINLVGAKNKFHRLLLV